jgi:hypothetical protein
MPPIGAAGDAPADRSERNRRKDVEKGRKEGRGYLLIGGLGKTMEDKAWTSKKS